MTTYRSAPFLFNCNRINNVLEKKATRGLIRKVVKEATG